LRIVGFDSTGPIITVGLAENGEPLTRVEAQAMRGTGGILERLIDEALSAVGWDRASVQGIALVTGPGSLTAMRIGWATAAGWSQATGIPVTGWPVCVVCRLHLAGQVKDSPPVYCTTHYRGDTFLLYDLSSPEWAPRPEPITLSSWTPQSPEPVFITGPGIIGRRREWSSRLRDSDSLADEREAIPGGDRLAAWGEVAISRGDVLSIEGAPLDYGLPPDFKKLIAP
jgi:hypothetical protein